MSKRHNSQQGFTLLEVLIATFIFSVMSVMSWQLLRNANEINQQARQQTASVSELHRLWLILRRDLYQVVAAEPTIGMDEQAFFYTTKDPFAALSNAGYGENRKVVWQLQDRQLVRTIWLLKEETASLLSRQTLLNDVVAVKWSFYDGGWKTAWRADLHPERVAAEMSLADGRTWRWVFQTDAGNLMRVAELEDNPSETASQR